MSLGATRTGVPAGVVHSLQWSPAGGLPKRPVPSLQVAAEGVRGDVQRDLRHHGGPERAVCLWAEDVIATLIAEGHPLFPGAAGDNVTVRGIDWTRVVPGILLAIGTEVDLEITRYTTPCTSLLPFFRDGRFDRISHLRHPEDARVYARVLAPGILRTGDPVWLVPAVPAGRA